ncbi:hypothetical protein [Bradyrhizobium sp. HKCCYLS20291]|uniref:hypothetical protein n=1 Tax=Bradyrhizobium sp. HKCCYLS20291 TaxID=3420766 RepID=UPI003EBB2807
MNSTWPTSFDQLLSSPAFPMWLTVAAAGFFSLIVLVTLLRAEKSVANGALTVITLLAVGIAVASMMQNQDGRPGNGEPATTASVGASPPALACIDDLAGDLVLSNCERSLFGTPEMTAAAVSYAAGMLSRLALAGDIATANKVMTAELLALRRAVERDRYGLMAYVLLTRDRCTPTDCVAFRAVGDRQQLVNNMEGRTYEGLVTRYASQWNAPAAQAAVPSAPAGTFAGLAPSAPTGKPTNAEFPSSSNTPPVSIMNPEPTASTRSAAPKPPTQLAPAPSPPATVAASHAQAPAAKKGAAPKPKPPATAQQAAPEAAEPAANNE